MKFNWGTGILLFIILFLLSAGVFIGFAMRQDVNLVHKDYYKKGVDHSEQMRVAKRSAEFEHAVRTRLTEEFLLVEVAQSLAVAIDSGEMLLYRPSSSRLDIRLSLTMPDTLLEISREQLIHGRYILQFHWFSDGLEYRTEEDLFVQ
ncbi:MAG: FixH family protein [Bacteroidota bacterium]